MTEQKAIWGSTRYFIKIEPYTNVFGTSMSGMVSFYDTHGLINENECRNLQEIVRVVNDFWSTILASHETRVARWIEEYLNEEGITADYNLLLRLLRAEELLAEDLEDLIASTREVETEAFEEAFEVDEFNRILGHEITVTRLPEDEYLRKELLQKLIEDNRYDVPKKVKSRCQFKLPNGEVKTTEKENPLGFGETLKDVTLTSGIKNEYDGAITDVEIIDEMPYCFKIENITVQDLEIEPKKEKKDKVLEIIWEIPEVQPNQEVAISYQITKRINRTILEIMENEVIAVLNTFENISLTGLDFISRLKYLNIHNRQLEELHIVDDIPPEFTIIKTKPEALPPTGVVEKIKLKGINVRWSQKNVRAGQSIDKEYILDYFPYIFRGKKIVQDKEGRTLFKLAKFIKSSEREMGYTILYVIKNVRGETEEFISLADKIPASHVVVRKNPDDAQIMEQTDDNGDKILTWIAEPPQAGKLNSVEVQISGDTPPTFDLFQVYVGDKGEVGFVEKESSVAREMIKTP
ncbi:MAG: hypothetical protein GOP50_10550 [Candidatus Heimdallarchaeota archaeon]|nr:hypothetical protein [Candidatus Heimdallarchaeota archaeon]